jgi:polysaccharide export outer membrane protein
MKPVFRTAFWLALLTVSVTGIASPGSSEPKAAKSAVSEAQPPEYRIGADDVLLVNVWKEAEVSGSVLVRPDGKISLPLIGDLRANGLTTVQLRDEITAHLHEYLADPEVTVIVQEAKSQRFTVLGEVEHPGSYALSRSMTVLDAIAIAGGCRDFAKGNKVFVLRVNVDGSRTRIPFNYKEAMKGKNLYQPIELKPRDTVVVP